MLLSLVSTSEILWPKTLTASVKTVSAELLLKNRNCFLEAWPNIPLVPLAPINCIVSWWVLIWLVYRWSGDVPYVQIVCHILALVHVLLLVLPGSEGLYSTSLFTQVWGWHSRGKKSVIVMCHLYSVYDTSLSSNSLPDDSA